MTQLAWAPPPTALGLCAKESTSATELGWTFSKERSPGPQKRSKYSSLSLPWRRGSTRSWLSGNTWSWVLMLYLVLAFQEVLGPGTEKELCPSTPGSTRTWCSRKYLVLVLRLYLVLAPRKYSVLVPRKYSVLVSQEVLSPGLEEVWVHCSHQFPPSSFSSSTAAARSRVSSQQNPEAGVARRPPLPLSCRVWQIILASARLRASICKASLDHGYPAVSGL